MSIITLAPVPPGQEQVRVGRYHQVYQRAVIRVLRSYAFAPAAMLAPGSIMHVDYQSIDYKQAYRDEADNPHPHPVRLFSPLLKLPRYLPDFAAGQTWLFVLQAKSVDASQGWHLLRNSYGDYIFFAAAPQPPPHAVWSANGAFFKAEAADAGLQDFEVPI